MFLFWIMGFALGCLHAMDPDHLAAVSTFISGNPSRKASARFALEWGIGHSLSLLVLTALVLVFGMHLGSFEEKALETAVGITLIGLGLWRLVDFFWERYNIHSHPHRDARDRQHEHFHVHRKENSEAHHDHSHIAGFVGLLHGAAGSARFLVLIPVALIGSLSGALTYVAFFSCGVALSMMTYAVFLGQLFQRCDGRFSVLQNIYRPLTGFTSLGLGIYWIASTL